MKLVGCGDSWMWGNELVDPVIDPVPIFDQYKINPNPQEVFMRHHVPENVAFRYKHRYQNIIANTYNAEVIDLSLSGASNNLIARELLFFLSEEDYLKGRDTSELLILIGWTSPFRVTFYTGIEHEHFNLLPNFKDYIEDKDLYNFYEYYTKHFWSDSEVFLEYASTVYKTECILKKFNIKYQMHQAFFDNSHYLKLEDTEIKNKLFDKNLNKGLKIWNNVDSKFFVDKNKSAYTYLLETNEKDVMYRFHPNVKGHKILADYFIEHLREQVL
jgi:hypothetical protein